MGPRESSKGLIQLSRPDDSGRSRGTVGSRGAAGRSPVSRHGGRRQSWHPPRAGRMQPPHAMGRGGAAVGRRDGGPGGLSGSEARVPEPPGEMLLRGLVTGFRGPGGGARLDTRFTMDCTALGLREATVGCGAREPGSPDAERTGGEGQGAQTRVRGSRGGERHRAPQWKPSGKAPQGGGGRQSTQRRADGTS